MSQRFRENNLFLHIQTELVDKIQQRYGNIPLTDGRIYEATRN